VGRESDGGGGKRLLRGLVFGFRNRCGFGGNLAGEGTSLHLDIKVSIGPLITRSRREAGSETSLPLAVGSRRRGGVSKRIEERKKL